ncbi:MAG: UvrD-helicase domain-containing protein [Planctomycetaceae bacterium]
MTGLLMERLTEPQQAAVEHHEGPLLVLAGPGSGKTRVITHRIARIVERGTDPRRILAITFTNKAAREMFDRVRVLVPGHNMWISTFHRFCAYLLRRNARLIGLKSNFTIFSTSDQKSVVKQVLNDLDIDPIHYPPANILNQISRAKNDLITAVQFAQNFNETMGDHYQAVVARAFPEYQKLLLRSNAVDFDDLLMHVVQLLAENDELRAQLDEHYQYILVDEYQDTNMAQYQLIRMLAHDQQNVWQQATRISRSMGGAGGASITSSGSNRITPTATSFDWKPTSAAQNQFLKSPTN